MTDQCHEEHQELKGAVRSIGERIDQVDKRLISHTSEVHQTLVERNEIEAADRRGHDETEAIAEALLGERRPEIMGGGRDPKGSLSEKLETNATMIASLYDDSQNGGLKTRLGKGVVTLLVAMIGALGYIGQAVIAHGSDTKQVVEQVLEQVDRRLTEFERELP